MNYEQIIDAGCDVDTPDDPGAWRWLEDLPLDPHAADVESVFQDLVARLEGEPLEPFRAALDELIHIQVLEADLYARKARLLMRLVSLTEEEAGSNLSSNHQPLEMILRSVAAEAGVALHVSDRTIQARLSEAWVLTRNFPATLHALTFGQLSVGHARVIIDEGGLITDPGNKIRYEQALIERASTLTPGRLRPIARLAATTLADVSFEERHRAAREARSVRVTDSGDGMSEVVATIPTLLATGIQDRLTRMGHAVKATNTHESGTSESAIADPRTLDQLRADIFCELLLAGQCTGDPHAAAAAIRAEVAIQIPATALTGTTLAGTSTETATIAGKGPISLADANQLAATAPALIRILTDPISQQVLAVDSYRPSTPMRRYLRYRDARCRYPTCNQAAWRCDIDHTIPHASGGTTEVGNLECLCPGHHTIKHLPGWSVTQTSPGILEWTTPHGITIIDTPDTPIQFT